jgi:hypothetical protein
MQLKKFYERVGNLEDHWSITETGKELTGFTVMDNGDLHKLLSELGIPNHVVEWEGE